MGNSGRWRVNSVVEGDDVVLVGVVDEIGREVGRWEFGYPDVTSVAFRDKDDVRRMVRVEIGRHVMQASVTKRRGSVADTQPSSAT
ncbi:MAG: hypothetical protein ACRCYX_15550 [Dermatophilaceae bacterium]